MSSSHKHSRDRPTSSNFYKGDYHSGDPHIPKRRSDGSSGGNRHYSASTSSYSNDRPYDEKRYHHGHSSGSSYHHPYSSSSHRQLHDKHTASGSHYSHHSSSSGSRYKSYEAGSSSTSSYPHTLVERVFRKPLRIDHRKSFDKVTASGLRRVPPPLSPPPLMRITTTASRYRQAPPEDRHHHRAAQKNNNRLIRPQATSKEGNDKVEIEKKIRKPQPEVGEKMKTKKRTLCAVDGESDKKPAKKKERREDPEGIIENPNIEGGIGANGTEVESKKPEKLETSDDVIDNKTKGKEDNEQESGTTSKPLLKLFCSYCDFRCISFKDFSQHTRSFNHGKIMNSVIDTNRKKLASLKHSIREQQKDLEQTLDEQKTLSDTTSYCRVCEINLRSDPKEHEANDIHNEIKALVYRKCELCDVDFRIWKVYLFHTVALEHVKRVALKQAKENENDYVNGTNVTVEEAGIDLLEQRTVIFCKACVRYFPIREDNFEETRLKHCMTLNHIKLVEEYTSRLKYLAKRDAEAKARVEERQRLKKEKSDKEAEEKQKESDGADKVGKTESIGTSEDADSTSVRIKEEIIGVKIEPTADNENEEETMNVDGSDSTKGEDSVKLEEGEKTEVEEGSSEQNNEIEDEEPDEDEIQLHADEDDVEVDTTREDE